MVQKLCFLYHFVFFYISPAYLVFYAFASTLQRCEKHEFSGSNGDICTTAPTMTAPPAKMTAVPSSLPISYPSPALKAHSIDSTDSNKSIWMKILPYSIASGICFLFLIFYFVHTTCYKKKQSWMEVYLEQNQ